MYRLHYEAVQVCDVIKIIIVNKQAHKPGELVQTVYHRDTIDLYNIAVSTKINYHKSQQGYSHGWF